MMALKKKHKGQKKKQKKFRGFQGGYTSQLKTPAKKYETSTPGRNLFHRVKDYLSGHRGIAVDLGLALYILFFNGVLYEVLYRRLFRESLLDSTSGVVYHFQTDYLLGTLLLVAMVGEFVAVLLKRQEMEKSGKSTGGLFFIWICHTVVSMVLILVALQAFGFSMSKHEGFMAAVFFAVVIKELVILFLIFSGGSGKPLPKHKHLIADLLMLFFYCVAYTVTWETLMGQSNINNRLLSASYSPVMMVTNTVIALLLFCIFYVPLRLSYFMSEKKYTSREKWFDTIIILLAAFMAVGPLFSGYASLEKALAKPGKVYQLFINSREMKQVPPEIGRLRELKMLHLGFNQLQDLPASFARLQKLKYLNLAGNRFTDFPLVITRLEHLETLDLHYNRLHYLPPEIGRLSRLKVLNLRLNRITVFPMEIAQLGALEVLNLEYNGLTEFPPVIFKLGNLEKLLLNHNNITRFPVKITKLKNLKVLEIKSNHLTNREIERLKILLPDTEVQD